MAMPPSISGYVAQQELSSAKSSQLEQQMDWLVVGEPAESPLLVRWVEFCTGPGTVLKQ